MVSYYSVVQYVPDPIANERVNIGVIVFGDGRFLSRFLRNWDRVCHFSTRDISSTRNFAKGVEQSTDECERLPPMIRVDPPDETGLRKLAERWMNSIQFTQPRAALRDPDALLASEAKRFLLEPSNRNQPSPAAPKRSGRHLVALP